MNMGRPSSRGRSENECFLATTPIRPIYQNWTRFIFHPVKDPIQYETLAPLVIRTLANCETNARLKTVVAVVIVAIDQTLEVGKATQGGELKSRFSHFLLNFHENLSFCLALTHVNRRSRSLRLIGLQIQLEKFVPL